MSERTVGWVVRLKTSAGLSACKGADGFDVWEKRHIFATREEANVVAQMGVGPIGKGVTGRVVLRVVRRPKENWGVWFEPTADNNLGVPAWHYRARFTRAEAEAYVATYDGMSYWTAVALPRPR